MPTKGRPKKRKADKRENTLKVRVTDGELEAFEDAARQIGAAGISAFARQAMLKLARELGVKI